MTTLTKVISTSFDIAARRIVKALGLGKSDVRTAIEALPYGIDSNPIKDMRAVYAPTGMKGVNVIVGYLNKNQLAAEGESRLFSTDENGILKFDIWLKNDGTFEIGGTADNAVRFSPLKQATDKLAIDIQAELVKIAAAITGLGGSYAPGTINIDISQAKINEVKTL